MNDKGFIRFISIILFLNISIFIVLGYYLFTVGIRGNSPIIVVQIILLLSLFYSLLMFKRLNKLYKKVFIKYKETEYMSDIIIKYGPTGLIVLNSLGRIEYINPIGKKLFTKLNPIGLNLLEVDSIKGTKSYNAIIKAFAGKAAEIRNEHFVLSSLGEERFLNVYIYPNKNYNTKLTDKILIMFHDVSQEINLKMRMESTYLSTIETLAKLVDARDAYTGEHSKNVSRYVELMCQNLDLPQDEIHKVQVAASFHDIGKIGVSDLILNKPGRLTAEEYDLMKKHTVIGADILEKIRDFEEVSDIIRHHHERWDGFGYPDGIKANQIPYGAQIIAIADTYDAIVSDRIYRKGRSKETALEILMCEKGKQFNPELVDIFVSKLDMTG